MSDRVRSLSPLIQGHFGGAFQDNFLGGSRTHPERL